MPDGSFANNDFERAEVLQQHFKSVFVVGDGSNPTIARMVPDNVNLGDVDFTPNGVFKALGSIKPNSACGPDGMSPRFLYMLRHVLCVPLKVSYLIHGYNPV